MSRVFVLNVDSIPSDIGRKFSLKALNYKSVF